MPRGTKVHLTTTVCGLPRQIDITPGQRSDYIGFDLLMEDQSPPKVLIADKGYDADRIRDYVELAGGSAVIPARRNRTSPEPIDGFLYALRNQVERCINKLKCARRIATRYDKTASSYLGFLNIAAIRIWTRQFVNRT